MAKAGKKIGIVTWFGSYNIGTNLQAYALQSVLKNMGFDAYLLHLVLNPAKRSSWLHRVYLCLRKMALLFKKSARYVLFEISDKQRYRATFRFLKQHCKVYELDTFHKYDTYSDTFCCAISGSDQIWNPYYVNDYHLLSFSREKIAYSSSLGVAAIPEDKQAIYQRYLPSFSAIAVRENTGNQLLRRLLQRQDIQTVLDPVFLISAQQWTSLAKDATLPTDTKEDFILCYLVGENDYYAHQVKKIAETLGIHRVKVVTARANAANNIDGEYCEWAGPAEFLALMLASKYVITDSFHATVLACILHADFVCLTRFNINDSKSQNSRITDLLTKFDCEKKLYQDDTLDWNYPLDFHHIDTILAQEKAASMNYLAQALSRYE